MSELEPNGQEELSPEDQTVQSLAEVLAKTDGLEKPEQSHFDEARRSVEARKGLPNRSNVSDISSEHNTP